MSKTFEEELEKFKEVHKNKYPSAKEFWIALRNNFKEWQPPVEKVKISKFLADWLEEYDDECIEVFEEHNIEADDKYDRISDELYTLTEDDDSIAKTIMKLLVNSYEVNKEKTYHVILGKTNYDYYTVLSKTTLITQTLNLDYLTEFTEAEIKTIDYRY